MANPAGNGDPTSLSMAGEPQPLLGMRLADLWSLMKGHWLDFPAVHWPKLMRATVQSLFIELIAVEEQRQLQDQIQLQTPSDPVIILGHPRSGTTHLFNLLSQDARLAAPSYLQVWFPHTFYFSERRLRGPWVWFLSKLYGLWQRLAYGRVSRHWANRGVDQVALAPGLPAEDSIAMAVMTQSEWMGRLLPRRSPEFSSYLDLSDPARRERWRRDWMGFLQKLSLRYRGQRLLLKSPSHTAKVPVISELFPKAKFLHIARHPYRIFSSFKSAVQATAGPLEASLRGKADEFSEVEVFIKYSGALYESYLASRDQIPEGHLHELRYEDLVDSPVEELQQAYHGLDLGEFSNYHTPLQSYLQRTSGYQTNSYPSLHPQERLRIDDSLAKYFEAFGY